MNGTDPLKQAWQTAPAPSLPPIDELRRASRRFDRRIRFRNLTEYVAAAFVFLLFGAFAIFMPLPLPLMRIGAGLVALGALVLAWQLHRRASPLPEPGAMPVLAYHRAQLVRQRDALASVRLWYLAPLVPGTLLMMLAPAIEVGPRLLLRLGWDEALALMFPIVIFILIDCMNRRAAGKLQDIIDDLDRIEEE